MYMYVCVYIYVCVYVCMKLKEVVMVVTVEEVAAASKRLQKKKP